MANNEISEIDALRIVDEAFSRLNDLEARDRVARWAFRKYASAAALSEIGSEGGDLKPPRTNGKKKTGNRKEEYGG